MFGLTETAFSYLQELFDHYNNDLKEVVIYGSRAVGDYRNGSDIDLAIKGNIKEEQLLELMQKIDSSSIPYEVDLSNYEELESPNLKQHIDECGIIFWQHKKNV
jgi:predicted nucleotidyltransferase